MATSTIKQQSAADGDVFLNAGTHSISLKRIPALIVVRGSGNNASAILLALDDTVYKVYEHDTDSITNLSISNKVVTATFTSNRGYCVFY